MEAELFDVDGRTGGWTDSRHEPSSSFTELCEVPDVARL
jgi:hypothetical protein